MHYKKVTHDEQVLFYWTFVSGKWVNTLLHMVNYGYHQGVCPYVSMD